MVSDGPSPRPPAVTVGIPFLNAGRFLADAVRSVFAQTFTDWELILVDDGSTDGSLETVEHLADPRVRILSDGVNRGLCTRLNQIALLGRGRYLARMDADDLMHPDRLQRQFEYLESHSDVDVLDTATFTIDDQNALLGIRGDRPLHSDPSEVLKSGLLIHPTVMGRAAWFRAHPYDGDYFRAEDYELWMRTCRETTFGRLTTPLFFYRESLGGNLKNYLASARTVRRIIRRYGPATAGSLSTNWQILRSHLKSFSYAAATRCGWQNLLIRSRNHRLDPKTVSDAQLVLKRILNTPVPGLNPEITALDSRRSALALH